MIKLLACQTGCMYVIIFLYMYITYHDQMNILGRMIIFIKKIQEQFQKVAFYISETT